MSHNEWTTHEVARLKRAYRHALDIELIAEFPRHPLGSIKDMARRQGLRKGATRTDTMRKYRAIAAAHKPMFQFGGAKA